MSEGDAALLLGETGGDLDLALMLVQRLTQGSPKVAVPGHPEVTRLQQAIDACSGSAFSVQELSASMAAFAASDVPQAVLKAQAAHHPLWQDSHRGLAQGDGLLLAIDRWIQFLRNDSASESIRYQRSQRSSAIAINLVSSATAAPRPDLRQLLLSESVCSSGVLDELAGSASRLGKTLEEWLINAGQIEGKAIKSLLERHYGMPSFNWSLHPFSPELVESFGLDEAQRCRLIPISRQVGRIVVGMLSPGDLAGLAVMRAHFAPDEVVPVLLRFADFEALLQFCGG